MPKLVGKMSVFLRKMAAAVAISHSEACDKKMLQNVGPKITSLIKKKTAFRGTSAKQYR